MDTEDTDVTGNTGNTAVTENTEDTGSTEDTAVTGNTEDTAVTGNTVDTGNRQAAARMSQCSKCGTMVFLPPEDFTMVSLTKYVRTILKE